MVGRQVHGWFFGDVPARFGVPDGDEVLHLYDIQRKTFALTVLRRCPT